MNPSWSVVLTAPDGVLSSVAPGALPSGQRPPWTGRASPPVSFASSTDTSWARVSRGRGLPALGSQKLYGPVGVSSPGLQRPPCWHPIFLVAVRGCEPQPPKGGRAPSPLCQCSQASRGFLRKLRGCGPFSGQWPRAGCAGVPCPLPGVRKFPSGGPQRGRPVLLLVASLRETLHFGAREPLLVPLGAPGRGDWDPGCPPEVTWFWETHSAPAQVAFLTTMKASTCASCLSVSLTIFLCFVSGCLSLSCCSLSVSVSPFISVSALPEPCALEAVIRSSAQGHLSLRKAGPSHPSRASSGSHNFSLGLGQRSLLLGISYYC